MGDLLLERLTGADQAEKITKRDQFIVGAFRHKFDTADIAKRLNVHESVVANRLARLRDAGR